MQVSIEETGPIGRKMKVEVPADELEQEIQARLRRMTRTVRIPGFRPGKAPLKVVDGKYRSQVTEEVAGGLIQSSFGEAVKEHKLRVAAQPDIHTDMPVRGAALEYVAAFDVYPEFPKLDLEGITITLPESQVEDGDVDTTIETMRKQRVNWEEADKAAELDDRVTIDFVGSIDDEPFEGGAAEDFAVELGSGTLLPDLESGLVGVAAGDEKTIEVSFPEDYHSHDLAGKTAAFAVTVKAVHSPLLPEVDEEFAKAFGIEDGNVTRMREEVKDNLEREAEKHIGGLTRSRIFTALLEANQTELPGKLVHEEIHRLMDERKLALRQQGMQPDLAQMDHAQFEPEARRRVALGLIMMELIERDGVKVDEDRVRERIESMAAGYEKPEEFVTWYYSDRQRVSQIESVVLEEQVVDILSASATVERETLSFSELMYGAQA